MKLRLDNCASCGGSATIRTEKRDRIYVTRAVCESCGRRSKPALDTKAPADGSASVKWATLYWNCGLFEEVKP